MLSAFKTMHFKLRGKSEKQQGFVLPVTVVMLALVGVGVLLMAHRSDETRALVISARNEQRASAIVGNVIAEAAYLSSVLHRRGDQLGEVKLDGRFYQSRHGALVSYLDAGAIFNLRNTPREELVRFLRAIGVPEGPLIDQAADQLLDYVDSDDLPRLNGAEASDYLLEKLPPPRNNRLISLNELERLPFWPKISPDLQTTLRDNAYIGSQRTVNKFTVRASVLAAVANIEMATAKDLISSRPPGGPANIDSILDGKGSYLAWGRYISVPSATIILTVCPPEVVWCEKLAMTSAGESFYKPWHFDFSHRVQRSNVKLSSDKPEALPDQIPDKPPAPLSSPFGGNFQ